MTSPRRTDYDQFDSLNPPGEPELDEAGAVASEGSQNTELSTWDTFGESTENSKKEKKGMLQKIRKGWNKRKNSDHVSKKDEKHADENDQQTSGAIQNEPLSVPSSRGKHKLPSDEKDHQRGSKRESTTDNPELARKLYKFEQYKEKVRDKASRVEKVKEELRGDFKNFQEIWKKEQVAFQKVSHEFEAGFVRVKQKLESSTFEVQRLSQMNEELKNKESEVQKKFEGQVSELKTNNQLLREKLAQSEIILKEAKEELTETKKSLDQVKNDAKLQEAKLEYTQDKISSLKQREVELSEATDTLKAEIKDMNKKMQDKEIELKKAQDEYKDRTEEMLSFSKEKTEILKKFHKALEKEKSLERDKMKLEKRNLSLTEKIEQMKVERTIQEQHQEHIASQETAKQWEYKLEESKSKLEEERKHFTELQHMFDMKKLELQQIKCEHKEKNEESETLRAQTQQLENQLEQFKREHQSHSQKLEQERSKLTVKHQEEMQFLMLKNAELKQQLRESLAIYEASKQVTPHVTMKIDGSISVPERNLSEVAQELQLLKPADTKSSGHLIRKQKSVELLTESSIPVGPNISMHSSAPGSLTKESSGDIKTNQEVTGLYSKSEDERAQPYESPHTSLTEVVHSVTVTEDNMTDAVKLNIQQEVALLQQMVQSLQEQNGKMQSELEALISEKNKLNKIKEKYYSLVSERSENYKKKKETESQSKASQTAPLVGPDVEMSLVAADVNIHRALGGLSMEKILQDKDMEISELKSQLEHALTHAVSKDGLDQVEISLREEHVDLQKAAETLNSRFTSMKKELTRVESQNSDVSMENDGLMRDKARLEEEKLQLQSAVAKFKKMSEYWQKKCEDEDIECKTAAQTAELTISLLQVDLNELKKKLSRKEDEVQTVKDCRKKLEEQLRIYQQERNRQDEQIAQLVAIKANLTHALSRYDSYAHEVGEFKQQSQQFQKALSMKISEVAHFKEEKLALQEEIKSLKEELDFRKAEVCGIQEDFQEERKDRARMASEMDNLKAKLKISREEMEEMEQKKEYWESQLNEARETWKMKQKNYETDIEALSDQVELLQTTEEKQVKHIKVLSDKVESLCTKEEEQVLLIDQIRKESDAKLKTTENRLLKEKKDHERTLKDLNHVTEKLQSTLQDYKRKLANASTIQQELQDEIAVLSADKSRLQGEKDEMHVKLKQCEREKMTSEKNLKQLCDYSEDLQETVSRLEREKEILHGETENMKISFQEERQHLTSVQRNLELKLKETRKHYDVEKQQWINQLKSLDLLRKTMKSQLDEEKVVAVERSEAINKYEQELLHLQECLRSMEYANAQYEHDITELKRHKVRLERENQQLHSKTLPSGDPSEDYHRLNQEKLGIEQQRVEYEKKYSILMDDYMDLRKLAQSNGLKIPQRRGEEPSQFSHLPAPSSHYVKPFNPEAYNLPLEHQQRPHTTYASGHGHAQQAYSEKPMAHPQYLTEQGSHSPSAPRVRRGSQDPSDVNRSGDNIRENVLIENIDDDISKAAAGMEEKVVETSLVAEDDARPLDSNLICPLCGKQFRIGQIQHYRHHVDNCTNRPT